MLYVGEGGSLGMLDADVMKLCDQPTGMLYVGEGGSLGMLDADVMKLCDQPTGVGLLEREQEKVVCGGGV